MSDIRIDKAGEPDIVEASDGRVILPVPIQIKRRSGRKLVTRPNSEPASARPWETAPTALQLALARGHWWLAMLTSDEASSLRETAAREGVDNSYVSRMVNPTTLAPDTVAAILDDVLPNHITLFGLAINPLVLWEGQGLGYEGRPTSRVELLVRRVGHDLHYQPGTRGGWGPICSPRQKFVKTALRHRHQQSGRPGLRA